MEKSNDELVMEELKELKKENRMIKTLFLILGALFFTAFGAFAFWWYQNRKTAEIIIPEPMPAPTLTVTLPSPTIEYMLPSPTSEAVPTSKPLPTVAEKSALEAIKEAFARKYSRDPQEITVTISKNDGVHASGGVRLGTGEGGGGWFLAAKSGGTWVIADDGNGTISCEKISPYKFPSNMAPECFTNDGKLIKR